MISLTLINKIKRGKRENMKVLKFLVKLAILLVPLIATISYSAHHLMSFSDGELPFYINAKMILKDPSKLTGYEMLVLGDSTANAAYAPEYLSNKLYNLALGGSSVLTSYIMFKDLIKSGYKPKHIFLSYHDMHLMVDDWFYKRILYMHMHSLRDEAQSFYDAYKFNNTWIYKDDFFPEWMAYRLWLPSKYITALLNAGVNQRKLDNRNHLNFQRIHQGRYMTVHSNGHPTHEPRPFEHFVITPFYDEYLKKMISLAQENNIKVTLIMLPLSEGYSFNESYNNELKGYFDQVKSEYNNFNYITRFSGFKNIHFADVNHMNDRGAYYFSTRLRELLPDVFIEEKSSALTLEAKIDNAKQANGILFLLNLLDEKDFKAVVISKDLSIVNETVHKPLRVINENKDVKVYEKGAIDQSFYSLNYVTDHIVSLTVNGTDQRYDSDLNVHKVCVVAFKKVDQSLVTQKCF